MAENLVELRHITKRFPKIVANDDISLEVRKGEIFALLGENGAGKSTLMSVLFGLYEPDEGEIYIRGQKVNIDSPLEANRLNIGMVHQHFRLVENQTVAENIILGIEPVKKKLGLFSKVDLARANREVKELSQRYNLEVNPMDMIADLPVSARQRVEILKMLYRNAEILIFDEPTAVLTPQEIDSLLDVIKSLRDGGKTIILITHKLDEIKKIADRCAILCKGKLIDVLDVKTTSTQTMAALMVGHEVVLDIEKKPLESGRVVLDVKHLSVRNSDGYTVVDDVSFTVHGGEILAVAGVAGNGQVEIADAIAGMTDMAGGSIEMNGEDISGLDIRQRSEKGISYIPEDRHNVGLLLDFDLADNLCLKQYYHKPYCSPHGILDFDQFNRTGEQLIKEYDIRCSDGVHTSVRSMSGGNQQKAIVARELFLDSDLFIFVQPTRGLDIGAISTIHEKIESLRDKGKAVLLISLELDEIMELADTILVMYNGKVQTIRKAGDLSKNQVGEYMMGAHHE
ncbi:MAG: ABC transporter ATP-binding protein [Spirochaetia bacterium]|nr:ABC transporter ATP-binding protein [Spirochaetia bacterium]